ncbi:MAG: isopenicillin N synthase family oxygenase [Pseudanabaena sp. RU_4_16]|nr:isopenicillin N synthase family oxygenase [Pseudanabaena sp. RU_4_16]
MLIESLHQTGFAVITGHPIAFNLIAETYQEWQQFFNSPAKHDYTFDPALQSGYFPFKSEHAKDSIEPDLKEFFHVYKPSDLPKGISDCTWQLFVQLTQLATEILGWIETSERSPDCLRGLQLSKAIADSPSTLLRILHYPPLPENISEGAIRAAAHEDINLITLLPAATATGLEILDNQGNWHEVPCAMGDLVVNVGDMLQLASQGYYRSTTHRVVNPAGVLAQKSRYSMPLFLHPRPEVVLADGITAKSYLQKRLREIGLLT